MADGGAPDVRQIPRALLDPEAEACPRCGLVDCSAACIAQEEAELNAYDGPVPKKFA